MTRRQELRWRWGNRTPRPFAPEQVSLLTILITGANGLAASHLADYILNTTDHEVVGTIRHRSDLSNISHLLGNARFTTAPMDVTDASSVDEIFRLYRPSRVFHLAAQSFVRASWTYPSATLRTNVEGTVNILEAARKYGKPVVHVAGSSEEYGLVLPHECPISEDKALIPLSPYGVSKIAQEMLAIQYWHSYKVPTVITRAFNHTGPRRHEAFAESSFATQCADREVGELLRPEPEETAGQGDERAAGTRPGWKRL